MKKLFKKLALMVVALLTFSVGSNYTVKEVRAASGSTFDFSAQGYANAQKLTTVNYDENITLTFSKANGSTEPAYYNTGTAARVYAKGTLTVTGNASVSEITAIAFTFGSGDKSNTITADVGTYSSNKWTGSSDKVVFTVGGTKDHRRFKTISVTYTLRSSGDTTPVLNFSSNNEYTMVESTLSLKVNQANLTEEIVWTSSDETVATVDNGIVKGLSMGKTTISASANGLSSNCIITVYPSNLEVITIAEAIKICEFTGEVSTPYNYSVTGVISSIDTAYDSGYNNISVTVTDDTGSIKVFRMKNGSELKTEDNITVTGTLVNYNGNTPEFNAGCTYVLNESEEIKTIRTELNTINTYMSLAYEYTSKTESIEVEVPSVVSVTDTLTRETTGIGNGETSYAAWEGKTAESNAVYSGNSAGNYDAIQLRSDKSTAGIVTTTSGGVARKITVVWNDKTTTSSTRILNIYGSHSPYNSPSDLYNDNSAGEIIGSIKYTSETELTIDGNYEYIGLRSSSGAMYINSISIEWEVKGESTGETITKDVTTFSSSNFFIRCGADVALKDIENIDRYGVKVSTSNNDVHYYSTSEAWGTELNTDPQYCYVVINLGDIINDVAKLTTKFTVEAFVEVGEDKYYSNNETTYSIVDMVKVYKEKNIEEVNHLYNYFVEEKLIVEEAN